MYSLLILVLSFLIISCSTSEIKEVDLKNKDSQSTPGIYSFICGLDSILKLPCSKFISDLILVNEGSVESNVGQNGCSQKCSKEIESLKKNITELYAAYMKLQTQLEHLNKHMSFHEKALKHIAVWSHRRNGHHHNDNPVQEDNTDAPRNESSSNDLQNKDSNPGSNPNLRAPSSHRHHLHHEHSHQHNHQHDNQHNHQHHIHRPHHSHNQNLPCVQGCPHGVQKGDENKETKKKDKDNDSSEESSEEQESKPLKTTVLPNPVLRDNESIALNDSQTTNSSEKSPKKFHSSKPSVEEQLYFQSMRTEFKEWFDDMLNDIHHNHHNHERVYRSDHGIKVDRRLDQSAIDDMENTLNSEDLVFATCNVKPNRHIALLNQQNVEGTINMWQLKHNRGPLQMHIKLKGFKVNNHMNGHQNVRHVRESILMPVEVEPDETTQPIGASHSHGFHVHEFGNMSRDCQSVGSHYNPLNLTHGGPYDVIRHIGDLGNIRCDRNGEIDSEYSFSQISLSGIHSIINRSIVVSNPPILRTNFCLF